MRKINVTFQIPDNDLAEIQLEQTLYKFIGNDNIIDYRKFPNTDQLKDDKHFKKLIKTKKDIGKEIDNYITNNK